MLTKPMLRTLWPACKQSKIDAIIEGAPAVLEQFEINTPLRLAHFMAQISHECDGGTIGKENMNYNAGRMVEIFGRKSAYVTPQEAAALAHRPEAIAERVYGLGCPAKAKRLGNTRAGDGYRYRGNGFLQITGRENYRNIGRLVGEDLENNPDLLDDPKISFKVAAAEFKQSKCLPECDRDNVDRVSKCVNLGDANSGATPNGISSRRTWLRKWKVAIDAEQAQVAEAPHDQIKEALEADAKPRAAESDAPSITPGQGLTITGAGGAGASGAEPAGKMIESASNWIDSLQSAVAPLQAALKSVQFLCTLLTFVGVGLTVYAIYRQQQFSSAR